MGILAEVNAGRCAAAVEGARMEKGGWTIRFGTASRGGVLALAVTWVLGFAAIAVGARAASGEPTGGTGERKAQGNPPAGAVIPREKEGEKRGETRTTLQALDASGTLFRNVNVVRVDGSGVQAGRDVLVREGRIVSVLEAEKRFGKGQLPEGVVREIDGKGTLYLMPGLCDMHVHFPPMPGQTGDPSWRAATLLIANGVTTARGMIGHPAHIELRRRVMDGELVGPTMHMAGPPVTFQSVKTEAQATAMVDQIAKEGFDFVKSHRVVSATIYDAVRRAGASNGLPVCGHVDNEVGLARALRPLEGAEEVPPAQIEHLDAFFAAILKDWELASTFGQMPTPEVKDQFDEAKIDEAARLIAERKAWSGPTMALFRTIALAHEPLEKWTSRGELRYIMPQAREAWAKQREAMGKQGPFGDAEFSAWFIGTRAKMLRAVRDAGGRILAGSDSPQAFLVTGFALHDELEAMVDAGLTTTEVLAAATSAPAAYFEELPNKGSSAGVLPDFGRVEAGARADLLLLRANPLESIDATREIEAVMVRGKLLDRAALDAMLAEVERSVAPIDDAQK